MKDLLSQLEHSHSSEHLLVRSANQGLTCHQLMARCHRLTEFLTKEKLETLAVLADNGIDWLLIDLACQQAGIRLLPLPTFFSAQQIQHALTSVKPDAIVTASADRIASLTLGDSKVLPVTDLTMHRLAQGDSACALPANTGKITFTSGSTGNPKGVCLSNEQLLQQAQALAEVVGLSKPKHLCVLPLTTLLENVGGIYVPLLAGGEVIVPSLSELGFSGSSSIAANKLTAAISHYQPNSMILTPQLLMSLIAAANAGWRVPTSLQFIAVGGSRVAPELIQQAHAKGIPTYEGYGLSECASVVSLNTPSQHDHQSSGRPLPHLQVAVEMGEIIIRGNAMLGYVNEPESWGQDKIKSGDLGDIDAKGFLHIRGRSKNLLISSYGRNISPEWIESELLANPLLLDCVVYGDARPYCVALISPRRTDTENTEIQQWLDQKNATLPDYAQIKDWYLLPQPLRDQPNLLTANGRPKREAIFNQFRDPIAKLYGGRDLFHNLRVGNL